MQYKHFPLPLLQKHNSTKLILHEWTDIHDNCFVEHHCKIKFFSFYVFLLSHYIIFRTYRRMGMGVSLKSWDWVFIAIWTTLQGSIQWAKEYSTMCLWKQSRKISLRLYIYQLCAQPDMKPKKTKREKMGTYASAKCSCTNLWGLKVTTDIKIEWKSRKFKSWDEYITNS